VLFTVSVKLLAAATLLGESVLIVGTGFEPLTTARLVGADVPLTGFVTVMSTEAALAMSLARTCANNCVELT
jgi:hypothetical protein